MNAAILERSGAHAQGQYPLVSRLVDLYAQRRAERRAIEQLRAMSDWQLLDLGIHRGQIDAVVRGLVER